MKHQDNPVESDAVVAISARPYGGVSPEQRRQMRRTRLVEAGLEVFGRRGLPHSTMRDICTRARLSDRYFYESFASVQEVFEAVYVDLRAQLLERLRASMDTALVSQVAMAEAGLRAFFTFIEEDPRRARMLIDALGLRYSHLGGSDEGEGVFQVEPYVSLFGDFFLALYPGADTLGIDVQLIHQTMIGMAVQSAAAWVDKGLDKSVDDIVRHNVFAWEGLDLWVRRAMAERDMLATTAADGHAKPARPVIVGKAKAA